jgi:hypothetical protein
MLLLREAGEEDHAKHGGGGITAGSSNLDSLDNFYRWASWPRIWTTALVMSCPHAR